MPHCQHHLVYLIVLSGCYASFAYGSMVKGELGKTVHLPCSYDADNHGILHMCWQKGPCYPFSSGCSPEVIKTDGKKVTQRNSNRYRLNGNLRRGNVTLTILRVTEEDSGKYCCRVEVKGLLNDEFSTVNLNISAGKSAAGSRIQKTNTFSASTTSVQSRGIPHTSSEWNIATTSYSSEVENIDGGNVYAVTKLQENGILVLTIVIVAAVIISFVVIILVLRSKWNDFYTFENSYKCTFPFKYF
ncbi:T-cell immunoglobulin and mucin domain-containing protein 4-like [Protopterus annectens]|uniref:T-cell immunoglobulin and mucin domain-containing protein 4-like n=1 Tax=Protopterus annectens TaxID=7888 RepID=UPI001CFB78D2|nr:T-cell immunoglobulin and mucin domain-containing protein 4-like [Protopterus annectens]